MGYSPVEFQSLIGNLSEGARAKVLGQLHDRTEPTKRTGGGVAALASVRKPGQMTKTEKNYAARLDQQKAAGLILGWEYETDRLKLADEIAGGNKKWFKVDFTVAHPGGLLSYDETKGSWGSDAGMERFRWVTSRYPHRWHRLWRYDKGTWTLELEHKP